MKSPLPIFQSDDQTLNMLQTRWASDLNPVLQNLLMQGTLVRNAQLTTGANTVSHKLGRPLIGWFVTRKNAAADIYDTQSTNKYPALTLDLVSDANVTVDIYCF